ncbi:MAG TPA: ParB/Srx family N-terminal domain-containing protein [Verrucomicrobiota bacterium]|nr:ParB/Srx family N-terminal domain-containing protein [Verrucomicrobiota bacterium]HNU53354.1 ParB/Srx family N-terminal domain-containing protein [Verrucomicrobiota bacterium]
MSKRTTQGHNAKAPATERDRSSPPVNCAFDELIPLEKLVPNPRNPNQHPPSQVALLAKVIAHQGWRSPIVVSKRSGFIVSGHGRYEAAKVLGLAAVPVDFQDFATDADEWAHLVADNRLAELAEADAGALKEVLGELKAADFDLDLAGFDADALAGLLAEPPEPTPPEDFKSVDENVPTDFVCPRCKYAWSGKPS